MITVSEQAIKVAKVWGVQKPSETDYRLIKYLFSAEVEDGTLLCNTVTGELVLLSEDEKKIVDALPAPYCEEMRELVERHFLVPVTYDEHAAVLQLRKLLTMMDRRKEVLGYSILPTTACNARCFYCFEADYKHVSMSAETAEKVIEFIKKSSDGNRVSLSWFGGEPTLGINRIDRICSALSEAGIEYMSSMISNGYLFDEEVAKKAKELWKLASIQITLDGTEETYNRVKSYVGVKDNPYQRVLRNIGLLLEQEIFVSVRMNLDRYNVDDLEALIGELAERFSGNENFSAYVFPLFDDCGFDPVEHSEDDRVWLIDNQQRLNAIIKEKKMYKERIGSLPSLQLTHCMADQNTSFIINPSGGLAKCEHFCEEDCGNVVDGVTDKSILNRWKESVEYPECADCPSFPTCIELKGCISTGKCFESRRNENLSNFIHTAVSAYDGFKKSDNH